MNKKIWILAPLSLALVLGSCSKDEPNTNTSTTGTKVEEVRSPIKTNTEELSMGVGETATIEILEGGGDYKVFSENPDIATATFEGSIITVTSKLMGWGGVVISDAKGNYKRVTIASRRSNELTLDQETFADLVKLGGTGTDKVVTVTAGNGEYTAVSMNPEVVKVKSVFGARITLVATGAGTTTVVVRDQMGLSKELPVSIETTTDYLTEAEKEAVKRQAIQRADINGTDASWSILGSYARNKKYTAANNRVEFNAEYGWGSSLVKLNFSFDGDLEPGVKTGASAILQSRGTGGVAVTLDNPKIEVLQNASNTVWIVISQVVDGKLYGAVFVNSLPTS